MPNYLSPGVYVEEVSGGAKPIAGVGTSTAAFVGLTQKGLTDKAILVTNWGQFVKNFGEFIPNGYLAYAVYGFFAEGGTSCYVVRVLSDSAVSASKTLKDASNNDVMTVTALNQGGWGNNIKVKIEDCSDETKDATKYFKLTVSGGEVTEIYDNISVTDLAGRVNGKSSFVTVAAAPGAYSVNEETGEVTIHRRPSNIGETALAGGKDVIADADCIGTDANKKGLHALDEIDDVNMIAIPDKAGDREVILAGLNYCANRKDCFFIADPPYGLSPTDVKDFKGATGIYKGENAFNSSYGALYYPWVYFNDPLTGNKKPIPPSGVVAGTYAYTDATRGVHKAPAGIAEGYLDSVIGIERIVTKGEHDLLNPLNINVIRPMPAGICIWGARTLSADSEWNYVNVRRLFLFLEESIDKGTQWVVFEPNTPSLWSSVKRNLTAFLTRVWRDGALFGSTPEEAFFVKVDEENNPPEVRDAGQLIIEVGVAPVKPAEFVVIRISQKTQSK